MGESTKEEQARVRDELLQALYRSVLRCTLARAQAGGPAGEAALDALAAGVSAALTQRDLLLLPARGAGSFRVLRGLSWGSGTAGPRRDLDAGVLTVPREEARAVSLALGPAMAMARGDRTALVAVLLPPAARLEAGGAAVAPRTAFPATWSEAAVYAARWSLPLLLLSSRANAPRSPGRGQTSEHLRPAPLFPSISVDRDDPLAIYRVAHECVARARAEGGGASHVEAAPFQVRGRSGEEPSALARLEAALRKRGAFQKAWRRQLERAAVAEFTT